MSPLALKVTSNIQKARQRMGLTQTSVASNAGVSSSYVSMLERGLRSPPLETVEKIADAIGVTPLSLFR